MSPCQGPYAEFQLENQRIVSGISTQPSRYKRAESNFPEDGKGS